MLKQDFCLAHAERTGGLHELFLAQRKDLCPDQAGVAKPPDQCERA